MGNRAVITTPDRRIGLYLHWNGGRDTVEPLLRYCELKGYRSPDWDNYGWARLTQVAANFFGGTCSIGIDAYTTDTQMNPGDNGIYVIKDWHIVERIYPYEGFEEQDEYDFDEILRVFDDSMPEGERLGDYLDAELADTSSLSLGDEVWMREVDDSFKHYPVVAFEDDGTPLIARYDHNGDWSWNPNNRVEGNVVRIACRR